jgi:hypothetical protein
VGSADFGEDGWIELVRAGDGDWQGMTKAIAPNRRRSSAT